MRKSLSLLLAMLLFATFVFAQNRVITGTVKDENGNAVPYATVKVKGGTKGVSADANGNFSIDVPNGTVLVIGSTGTSNQEITVTADKSVYGVSVVGTSSLSEVVVSALGIKRSVKSTPYTAQSIDGAKLTATRETDLTTALSGKIAGLQVLGQSGASLGSSGTVRLRGVAGIEDDGAIYVINGTIVENVSDINMDDVANVTVLKGPNATALYGQRAQGGVIMLTLKNAVKNKPLAIDLNSTTVFEKVNRLPNYQNIYGGGNKNNPNIAWAEDAFEWKAGMPDAWKALNGARRPQYYDDASWGPKMDGGDYIPWYAWYGGHADSYKTAKYVAHPDNIRDFYQTGVNANNNISLSKGGKNWDGRFGYTNLNRKGIVPNSTQQKHFFSTQDNFNVGKHITISTNVGVTFEDFKGDFYDEYGNNTIGSFSQWFHRDIDMNKMKELRGLKSADGTFASWNIDDATGISSNAVKQPSFWYNPYTWLDNLSNKTHRFRTLGSVSLAYKFNDAFKVTGTYRMNYRTTNTKVQIPKILEASTGTQGITSDDEGISPLYSKYRYNNTKYVEQNLELIAEYNKKFNDFSLQAVGGINLLLINRDDSSRRTAGGLINENVFEISNSKSAAERAGAKSYTQKRSAFARATLGYKDYIFLDVAGRIDASSTLPVIENTYVSPSAGLSFIFSDFIKHTALSYGKVRFSLAQIGSDPLNPYATQFNYTVGNIPFGTNPLSAVPNSYVNPYLKSPKNTSYEAGIDLKFFRDRIGLNTTVYTETRTNDIVPSDVSTASGFISGIINAGKVRRKGVEIELNLKPVVSKNFTWDVSFNWAMNRSQVLEVSPSADQYTIYSAQGPTVLAVVGKQWGQIRSKGVKRINGVPVLNIDGTYVAEENIDFGGVLPNYTGGVSTSFGYKGFKLAASVDFQQGGKYFSLTDMNGKLSGLTKETAATNDKGVNVREPVANGGGVHVYGVLEDGKPYDTYINSYDYYRNSINSQDIWDFSIFDASSIKLREVSLGYQINVKKLGWDKTLKGAYISVVARNIWMWTKNSGTDPTELASTYADNGQLPGTKSIGVNLKLNF